jgi:uncharacterized protein
MKLIKVQGKGHLSCPPDTTIISFAIEVKAGDYAQCLQHLNHRTDDLRRAVAPASSKQAALKTTAFNVTTDTEYKDGRYVQVGYQASHRLQIELPMDTPLLNCILREVAGCHSGAQIGIAFSVKDQDALRARVLADAVRAAKANACVLADAAGVKLGPLQHIEYGWAEVRIQECEAELHCKATAAPSDHAPDIQPQDVAADDNVTLVYAIEE